jgi:hypothetical protein
VKASTAAIVCFGALLIGGCTGSDSGTDAIDSGRPNPGTSNDIGGTCDGFTPGKDGVVRTFCEGTGQVSFTVDGATHTIKKVACAVGGGYLDINGGIVVGPDFTGDPPDYVGMKVPMAGDSFTNIALTFTAGGRSYALTENFGSGDAKSGTFAGKDYASNAQVSGSYTCG